MLVVHKDRPCHPDNYRKGRKQAVKYLVIHYVGAKGDAMNNAKYYGTTPGTKASAHYFVGHGPSPEIWASVAEWDTAWHVGAKRYTHLDCRNENAIGVELCCHQNAAGTWYFDPETVDMAVELCRDIVARYGITKDRVLRHYDVTGKICPAPFVNDPGAWDDFLDRVFAPVQTAAPKGQKEEEAMKQYHHVAEMPDWARGAATRAIDNGYIKTDTTGAVNVWETNLQTLVWMDRAGMFDGPAVRE